MAIPIPAPAAALRPPDPDPDGRGVAGAGRALVVLGFNGLYRPLSQHISLSKTMGLAE